MGGLVSDTLTTKGSTTLYSVRLSNANGQCTAISWNGYAGDGNVVESQDSINGTWTYQYDDMNRLISATQAAGADPLGSSGGTVSWTYDRFGNRWSQAVTGQTPQSYTFMHNGVALDHRMEQYRSSYDPAGNLTWDPPAGNYLTYDDENRVIKVGTTAGASNIAQYWYDAEGQRIRKVSAAGTEEYVYDVAGRQIAGMQPNGSFNRVELYAGSRHLATYEAAGSSNPAQTVFIHNDWQGTERVRSKYDGTSYQTCTNLPYGDQQTCTAGVTDPSPLHYTGKMRDAETNLDYFGARYYSSGMGHWMTPDWDAKPAAVPYANFGDPQSLNLYAMVNGSPVSHQDSDGHLIRIDQQYASHGLPYDVGGLFGVTDETNPASPGGNPFKPGPGQGTVSASSLAAMFAKKPDPSCPPDDCARPKQSDTPKLAWWDIPGHFFVGFTNVITGHEWTGVKQMAQGYAVLIPGAPEEEGAAALAEAMAEAAAADEGELTAAEIIAKTRQGGINREFPGQFRDSTLKEIKDAAKAGDAAARKH